jgi:undecaprenyl-diphosphatase
VATALALIAYFWRDWLRIISGFVSSVIERRVATADQRLAWMIILATIPVGIAGLELEHLFRVVFSRPILTATFLAVNGLILLGGERLRQARLAAASSSAARTAEAPGEASVVTAPPMGVAASGAAAAATVPAAAGIAASVPRAPTAATHGVAGRHASGQRAFRHEETAAAVAADARLSAMSYLQAVLIGSAQILALLPGISRDGVVTVGGMMRGFSREDAVRFSFLLSAPVILAAGVLKIPSDLLGPLGNGIRGQILAGSVLSFVGAYLSVRFLVRYFRKSGSLTPFAIYCLVAGLGSLLYLVLR